MRNLYKIGILGALALCAGWLSAQQPQTHTAPTSALNAKWTNGVAPGYAITAGAGLVLNVGGGTANCGSGTIIQYAGGALTMSAEAVNYVYLNTASSCAPSVKTSAFSGSDIPLAVVSTSGSAITGIVDDRTPFNAASSGVVGAPQISPGAGIALAPAASGPTTVTAINSNILTPMQTMVANAAQNIFTNTQTFSDSSGTYWTAGAAFTGLGVFADDLTLAAIANPAPFDAPSLENIISKFEAVANGLGEMPVGVAANGTAVTFWSGDDNFHAHASGDAQLMLPQLQYLAWQKSGSTAGVTAHIAALNTALNTIQINSLTHLCQSVSGSQWMPWLFQETALGTGDLMMCSVWLARDYQVMNLMYTAIGNSGMAATYAAKETAILASLSGTGSPLWNSGTGMYRMATLQNSANVDVDGSALMVYFGFATPAQATSIGNWLATNVATIEPDSDGYLRQSNTNFAFCGSLNSDGTQAISTSGLCAPGVYQQGKWTVQSGWVLAAIAAVNPAAASGIVKDYMANLFPSAEWSAVGNPNSNGGSNHNLESPMGPLNFAVGNQKLLPPNVPTVQDFPFANVTLWEANLELVDGASRLIDPTRDGLRIAMFEGTDSMRFEKVAAGTPYGSVDAAFVVMGTLNSSGFSPATLTGVIAGYLSAQGGTGLTASGAHLLANAAANTQVVDVENTDPAGVNAIDFVGTSGAANDGAVGYANGSYTLYPLLTGKTFLVSKNGNICLSSKIGARAACDIEIDKTTGDVTLNNLNITGSCPVCATGRPFATPTTPTAGAVLVNTGGWDLNDNVFTFTFTPSTTIAVNTVFMEVDFGAAWSGPPHCNYSSIGTASVGVVVGMPVVATTFVTFQTGPAQTLTSGTTYIWTATCWASGGG